MLNGSHRYHNQLCVILMFLVLILRMSRLRSHWRRTNTQFRSQTSWSSSLEQIRKWIGWQSPRFQTWHRPPCCFWIHSWKVWQNPRFRMCHRSNWPVSCLICCCDHHFQNSTFWKTLLTTSATTEAVAPQTSLRRCRPSFRKWQCSPRMCPVIHYRPTSLFETIWNSFCDLPSSVRSLRVLLLTLRSLLSPAFSLSFWLDCPSLILIQHLRHHRPKTPTARLRPDPSSSLNTFFGQSKSFARAARPSFRGHAG
mmetsp:Transcript_812/g.1482  ORF Transcript_812/g.1482 Transcript_812/m.1482 type:complete len:253 (-) Transcript_812:210-968(-)